MEEALKQDAGSRDPVVLKAEAERWRLQQFWSKYQRRRAEQLPVDDLVDGFDTTELNTNAESIAPRMQSERRDSLVSLSEDGRAKDGWPVSNFIPNLHVVAGNDNAPPVQLLEITQDAFLSVDRCVPYLLARGIQPMFPILSLWAQSFGCGWWE